MQVIKHAEERLKERCGLNDKSSERITKTAYEKGLRHGDLTGNLKKWVGKQYFYNHGADQIRLCEDKAYVFHNRNLIAVIQISYSLVKDVVRICKEKS